MDIENSSFDISRLRMAQMNKLFNGLMEAVMPGWDVKNKK